jgi:hypothetical protein
MVIVGVIIEEVCQIKRLQTKILKSCFILSGMNQRGGGHMNGNRNGYNNNNNNNTSRPTRFSAKRSRSRSPIQSTYGHGNEFKRPRTDTSHVCTFNLNKRY